MKGSRNDLTEYEYNLKRYIGCYIFSVKMLLKAWKLYKVIGRIIVMEI